MNEKGRIVNEGMGGFLCPPGHPMHHKSVETDLRRRPENRGRMCLTSAADCEWLDDATRSKARQILADWQPLPLDSPKVREWVLQVLGYFRGCYCRGNGLQPEDWHAVNLLIVGVTPGLEPSDVTPDKHAGVHLIRKYYSDFTATDAHFEQAYWGKKPS